MLWCDGCGFVLDGRITSFDGSRFLETSRTRFLDELPALVDAFERHFGITIRVRNYHEHAMAASADAAAAAYVEVDVDDEAIWGVGVHKSIATASLQAVVNAVNRSIALRLEGAALDGARRLGHQRLLDRRLLGQRQQRYSYVYIRSR